MKLNYKRTIFVGLAFFLITLFWQTYDAIIPKILTDKFGMPHAWSGVIMAIDNVLALFLLPLFGSISDKHKGKKGRRTPFITFGAIIAAVALIGLSAVDNAQLKRLEDISAVADPKSSGYSEAMETLYDSDVQITVDGKAPLSSFIEKADFLEIGYETVDGKERLEDDYNKYVTPARQAYAARVTSENVWILVAFVGMLLVALLAMSTFRSPAVALMPDVTPKPLRSKANAVINLMGTLAGILILVVGKLFGTGSTKNVLMNYIPVFAFTAGLMMLALLVFRFKVNEPKFVSEMEEQSVEHSEEKAEGVSEERKLSKAERRSLIFILLSVVMWFMGYNAVTTKYSVYAPEVLGFDYNTTLLLANAAALAAFIPVGIIASKIGRKKTILAGVAMLFVAFGGAIFLKPGMSVMFANVLFALAGIGWATINVNSYPMVVELSSHGNVGKYTGFYYTATMTAQTLTPILSGFFLDTYGMRTLFPYATICVGISFVTMLFVKHGDSKPLATKPSLESLDVD